MTSFKEELTKLCQSIINEDVSSDDYADKEYNHMKQYVGSWLNENKTEGEMSELLDTKFGFGSNKYLPQLMREIQGLDETVNLNEDYDDRIELIVKDIMSNYPEGIGKEKLRGAIEGAASRIKAPELRMGPRMMKELTTDVVKVLSAKGAMKRAKPAPRPEQNLMPVAIAIMRYAGEAFPDGDPIDMLIPWLRKKGYTPDSEILDKAARKYLGVKSYNDYLADLYADFTADNPGYSKEMGLDPDNNPWRESIEEGAENPNAVALQYEEGVDKYELNNILNELDEEFGSLGFNSEERTIFFWDNVDEGLFDMVSNALKERGINNWKIENTASSFTQESLDEIEEVAPKGWGGTVKAMKKHPDRIENPFALAHWMKKQGRTPHYSEGINEDNGFITGEKVKHKEQNKVGVVVGYEGDETAVRFENEPDEVYFVPNQDLELVEDLNEIEAVADPHGGSMISPYDNEPDDGELDRAYEIVVDQALSILNYDYSDVLESKEAFLEAYNLEDIDVLAEEIAHDAVASSKGAFDDPDIVYAVDIKSVADKVASVIRRKIGITEDRDYFMNETLKRIKNLAGIRK